LKARENRRKLVDGEGERAASTSPLALSAPAHAARQERASVGVVGAGRLGTALARALAAVGYRIEFLLARDAQRARRAATLASVEARALNASRLGRLPRVDLLLLTTPDDALAETIERIGAAAEEGRGVALHTSGALSSEVLAPLRGRGYAVGSLHPLVAVSEAETGAESLRRAYFCVEGDARAVRAARRLVRDLGARSFSVPAELKALYHAAAVMSAGHAVALFDTAAALLAACGLDEREARRVLLPLLRSALDNLSRQEPAAALTGTFARADVETARKHLAALKASGDDEALELYRLLGRRSLRLAAAKGADAQSLELIARALAEA
jgi:predicted short-subunit dehydrogenase-like oxidoreductase (DUF2520 family)